MIVTGSEGFKSSEVRIQEGMPTVSCSEENSRIPTCVERLFCGFVMRKVSGWGRSEFSGLADSSCSRAVGGRRIWSEGSFCKG